jgi:hypothetical protein
MNCTLAVPASPLTAQGLATPWQLGDGCSMANAGTEGAFVEATILGPNGSLQVYNPLVVTAGTQPAVEPAAPTIAAGSVVEISIGFNGTNLALTGAGARQGNCVDASGQSLIGQVSACNAVNFYNTANADIARGTLTVPPNGAAPSQALNELSARVNQQGVIAVVPPNDEMTLVGGNMNIAKTNVYRSLVDQPLLAGNTNPATVAASYCQNMVNIAAARNNLDMAKDAAFGTPVATVGNNLATFLGNRLSMSFTNLNCGNFGLKNPVTATLDGNGVATAITYSLTQQQATGTTTAATGANPMAGQTTGTQATGPRRFRWQNPSGT